MAEKRPGGVYVRLCMCEETEGERSEVFLCRDFPTHILHMWAFNREMRRNQDSFFPSLQVFQEAASLFLDLLGKLLAQPDDSEQALRRDSLMVICSPFQISLVFPHVPPILFFMTI